MQTTRGGGCDLPPPPEVAAAAPQWVAGEAGSASLRLTADPTRAEQWQVEVQLRLGALSYTWIEEAAPAPDGTLSITLHPPAAAFVHPLAEDYVSDLALRVVGLDAGGRRVVIVEAPPAYLAWPAGPSGAPAVWDGATMAALAPYGVVDPGLRASLTLVEAVDRVFPPLYGGAVVDETPVGDE